MATDRAITVLRSGPLTVITDLGRPGQAHIGVPRSGALDRDALRLANRLVGNPDGYAGLEVLLGGLELRAESNCTVAVTGPPVPAWRHGGGAERRAVGFPPGRLPACRRAPRARVLDAGLRSYLACSGGLDVPEELGSRSTDLLSGLGPAKVSDGDRLALGAVGDAPADASPGAGFGATRLVTVPVLLGPRDDWFVDPAGALRGRVWTVGPASNDRAAVGREPLERAAEWDGQSAQRAGAPRRGAGPAQRSTRVVSRDAPTTGGYPVVGVVPESALAPWRRPAPAPRSGSALAELGRPARGTAHSVRARHTGWTVVRRMTVCAVSRGAEVGRAAQWGSGALVGCRGVGEGACSASRVTSSPSPTRRAGPTGRGEAGPRSRRAASASCRRWYRTTRSAGPVALGTPQVADRVQRPYRVGEQHPQQPVLGVSSWGEREVGAAL